MGWAFGDKIPAALMQQARRMARDVLLKIGKNALYSVLDIIQPVIEAAVAVSSIERKAKTADADTVFHHLEKLSVEEIEQLLKRRVKRAVKLAKRRFGDRKFAIAVDYTDEMFYGDEEQAPVVGTKHKDGSNYAFKYLTVNIVMAGCRFFLFAYPIFARGENWFYLEKVLDLLEEFEVKTYVILLDREFNDSKSLCLLQERGYKYIIPADQDSKFERWKKAADRFPAIFRGWSVAEVETTLIMLEEEEQIYGYLTNLPEDFYRDNAFVLSELYSKRWGIETAHRVEDDFRIYTTTRNGVIRYFFFVISVLVYNLWVWVNLNFGLEGNMRITVAEIKEILSKAFDEFWRWRSSSERWFSLPSFGNLKSATFGCLQFLSGSAEALP